MVWEVLGNIERVQFVAELWMTRDKMEQSFVRRWSTEPFSLVFGGSCLLPSSLCSGDDLVCNFVPSSNCRRWLPIDTWHRKKWACPVSGLLLDPGGNLATPDRNDGIELNHPSSTKLHTAWIPYYKLRSYLLASYGGCQWGWQHLLLGLKVWNWLGVCPQKVTR